MKIFGVVCDKPIDSALHERGQARGKTRFMEEARLAEKIKAE